MAQPIVISSQGMYTAEGKLVSWLRPAGAKVEAGEAVAEVETEKAIYEVEAGTSGILHPVAQPGANLPLESVIGYLLAEGEAPPTQNNSATLEPATRSAAAAVTQPQKQLADDLRASPIAKRLAREHGVDLTRVVGTGPGGRIVEADVIRARARQTATSVMPPAETRRIRERIPLTGMRGTIAERMRHSLATAASLTITREVNAEILASACKRLELALGEDLPYDALFVKIFADALEEHPKLNATIEQDAILVLAEINVGFALAIVGGVVVPVVHKASSASFREVVRIVKQLREHVLAGRLRVEEVSGGTATISNLGAYGVDAFTPILNPPESVVLGIGRIAERAIAHGGGIKAASTCVLSLTFDHRVADGVPAAQLLDAIARRMNDPDYLARLG